jgi:IS66 Orf2 like protein
MDFASEELTFIVYKNPINMHRSFNGLISLAINELQVDLQKDFHILFMNRDRNQFKILFFKYNHASIFSMRLSGRLQADFTKMDTISSSVFYDLVKTPIRRKDRFWRILEDEN